MTKRLWWTLILVVVASLCLAGWTNGANTSSKVSWEYKVLSTYVTPPEITQLNDAGAEGWELVSVRSGELPKTGSNQVRTEYFLKRVK
jgi:hypothetical protein